MDRTFNLLGLKYNQEVIMTLTVNGQVREMDKLVFIGRLNPQSDWLHFVHKKTGVSHLVRDDQYPRQRFNMGPENVCIISYQ